MSDINAGSVSVEVVPDARLFAEKLRAKLRDAQVQVVAEADTTEAKKALTDVARDRVAKVTADTTGAKRAIDELKAKRLQLSMDTAQARVQLAELQQQIAAAKAAVKVNADDEEAKAKLAALQAQYGELRLKVNADTAAARLDLERLRAEAAADPVNVPVKADTKQAEQGISNLTTAAVALGPALVPVAAATAGLAAALSAPLAAAGGGVTLYTLLAGKTVADTEKLNKQINALDAKAVSLTDPKAKKAVIAQRDALYKSLSKSQQNFLTEQAALASKFGHYEDVNGKILLGPLTQGMKDLADILPRTTPLVKTASGALSTLLGEVDQSVKSGSLAHFLDFMTTWSGSAIVSFGRDLGNIASGITGLIQASAPLSGGAMNGLEHLTGRFAKWGQNAGTNNFQDFLRYARKEGPQAARTLGDIAGAFGAIAKDAAPIGGTMLKALDAFAKILHRIADSKAGPTLIEIAAGFAAVKKLRGLSGGLLSGRGEGALAANMAGGASGAIGKGVMPVYVTNWGKNGAPGEPGNPGSPMTGPHKPVVNPTSKVHNLLSGGGLLADLAITGVALGDAGNEVVPRSKDYALKRFVAARRAALAAAARQNAQGQAALSELLLAPAMKLGKVYASLPKQVKIAVATPGVIESMADVKRLKREFDLTPKQVRTLVQLSGVRKAIADLNAYDRMMQRLNGKVVNTYLHQLVTKGPVAGGGHPIYARAAGGPVTSGHPYLVGEQGPELLVPSQSGRVIPARQTAQMLQNGRTGGVDVHIHGDVRPLDYRDFMGNMQARSRTRSLGVLGD